MATQSGANFARQLLFREKLYEGIGDVGTVVFGDAHAGCFHLLHLGHPMKISDSTYFVDAACILWILRFAQNDAFLIVGWIWRRQILIPCKPKEGLHGPPCGVDPFMGE